MTWFKVDDCFYDHPKTENLPLDAAGLWLMAGTYCARHLTDGFISRGRCMKLGATQHAIDALLASGLWVMRDDGYSFNDWHDYQPTRESVLAKREKERTRKAKQRESKRDNPQDVPEGVPQGHRAESMGVSAYPVPARPVPARPPGKALSTAGAADFADFWAIWPRKVGKGAASKAWAKAIKVAAADEIIAGAQRFAADPNKPDDRNLWPHPSTWLNQERWLDEPYPPQTNGRKQSGTNLYAVIAGELT